MAKNVQITEGYVSVRGLDVDSLGNPYTVFWEVNIKGNNFSRATLELPDGINRFGSLFGGGYDTGQNFPTRDFAFPFRFQEQTGTAFYNSFTYSKVEMNAQDTIYFRPQAAQAQITATSSETAVASIPFEATGNLTLKCSRLATDCNAPIRRVRIYGKGTAVYNFVRWTPSDGQWHWLNVKSIKYNFEQ